MSQPRENEIYRKILSPNGCRCVYCRGTREDLANYAAELARASRHNNQGRKRKAEGHD